MKAILLLKFEDGNNLIWCRNKYDTHVLANWIEISRSNSPTDAISSVFQSPFGCDTSKK